jgi:hypothetical protein
MAARHSEALRALTATARDDALRHAGVEV